MTASKASVKYLFSIGRVLLFYVCSVVIFATCSGAVKNVYFGDHLSFLTSSILTFLLVIGFAKWEKLSLKDIGLKIDRGSFLRFSCGIVIGCVMVVVQAIIISSFAKVKFSLTFDIQLINVITSLILYFLIACREELVFRSYSLRSLAYSINAATALVIITIIFIIEHVIGGSSWKMAILGSGFGGVLFGLSALKSKGLALPLGLHFSWNAAQWLLGFKNNTGVWREIVEKGQESHAENIGLAGFIFVMSVSIAAICFFYKGRE